MTVAFHFHYSVRSVLLLPRSDLNQEKAPCMPPVNLTFAQRIPRQLRPRPQVHAGCWFHGGDWREVGDVAARITREAYRLNVTDVLAYADLRGHESGLGAWARDALDSLFLDPIDVDPIDWRAPLDGFSGDETFYSNGRHRTQALLEAGARWTPVGTPCGDHDSYGCTLD